MGKDIQYGNMSLRRRVLGGTLKKWYLCLEYMGKSVTSMDNYIKVPYSHSSEVKCVWWASGSYFLLFKLDSFETLSHSTFSVRGSKVQKLVILT